MELTLASAFSTGGLVGHLSYLLLVVSMMMRSMVLLRILVLSSSTVGIIYVVVWLHDPVSTFWETALIIVNVIQLTRIWLANRMAQFNGSEREFVERRLRGMTPGEARKILNLGAWRNIEPGTELTRAGERPDFLTFVASGTAEILAGDQKIANCGPGRYVGEMSFIAGGDATATAIARSPMRVWQIPFSALEKLQRDKPGLSAVIEAGIARDMRRKLIESNHEQMA